MKNFKDSIKSLEEHYLETLKYISRNFDINLEMFEQGRFSSTLYGEAVTTENLINSFEVKIKENAIIAMARFQPAAKNLRELVMLINSVRVLERMGDLLKANLLLVKKIEKISPEMMPILKDKIFPMAEKIKSLLEMYMKAFLNHDVSLLYDIITLDEEIDSLFKEHSSFFISLMKEKSENVEAGSHLMLLDKKLERLSDHIVHLVLDLIYILKGENMRKTELANSN